MTDQERVFNLRERYLRDPIPTRLGNLASSLARLASSAALPARRATATYLLLETESFIEWTGPMVAPAIQPELADMQVELARWRLRYESLPAQQIDCAAVAELARHSSQRVLQWSGLLEQEP